MDGDRPWPARRSVCQVWSRTRALRARIWTMCRFFRRRFLLWNRFHTSWPDPADGVGLVRSVPHPKSAPKQRNIVQLRASSAFSSGPIQAESERRAGRGRSPSSTSHRELLPRSIQYVGTTLHLHLMQHMWCTGIVALRWGCTDTAMSLRAQISGASCVLALHRPGHAQHECTGRLPCGAEE